MGLFIKKYAQADLLVADEGEVAFTNIIKTYLDVGRDRKKLRDHIEELGNYFYINEAGSFIEGPEWDQLCRECVAVDALYEQVENTHFLIVIFWLMFPIIFCRKCFD